MKNPLAKLNPIARFAVLAVVVILATVAVRVGHALVTADYAKLVTYSSPQGGYEVLLPAQPTITEQQVDASIGPLEFNTAHADAKYIQFVVGYTDYPAAYIAATDPGTLLDGASAGFAGSINGKQLARTAFAFRGFEARDVLVKVSRKMYVSCRILLAGNRLYQIIAVSNAHHIKDAKVKHVLDSFRVTQPLPTPPGVKPS
jgi:hypothetical protein